MEKYLFTVNADTMSANSKSQEDLNNIIKTALPRYGTVEPFNEDNVTCGGDSCACEGIDKALEIQSKLDEANTLLAEYAKYDTLIDFVKAMNAEHLSRIEELTKRVETAEEAADELAPFKELIEVAKKLQG